jgi:rod shape-determining protein MreC
MKRRIALITLLAVAALALLTSQVRLSERRAVGRVGSWILAGLGPAEEALSRAGDAVARVWRQYTEIGRLRAENQRLGEEVERLKEEVTRLREQAQATQRLERLLAFREQLPGRAIGARVIGRDSTKWFSVITVDRGSQDGVHRNAPVVAAEGLVGRVLTVTPTTAQVLLVSDARSAVGVVLQQSRRGRRRSGADAAAPKVHLAGPRDHPRGTAGDLGIVRGVPARASGGRRRDRRARAGRALPGSHRAPGCEPRSSGGRVDPD